MLLRQATSEGKPNKKKQRKQKKHLQQQQTSEIEATTDIIIIVVDISLPHSPQQLTSHSKT